jgi:hypothetical protein
MPPEPGRRHPHFRCHTLSYLLNHSACKQKRFFIACDCNVRRRLPSNKGPNRWNNLGFFACHKLLSHFHTDLASWLRWTSYLVETHVCLSLTGVPCQNIPVNTLVRIISQQDSKPWAKSFHPRTPGPSFFAEITFDNSDAYRYENVRRKIILAICDIF